MGILEMVLKTTMTTTVNTIELKTQANRLLRRVATKHQLVLITRRGRPCAALIPISNDNLADLLWEYSPDVQRRLKTALDELHAAKAEPMKTFARRHGLD